MVKRFAPYLFLLAAVVLFHRLVLFSNYVIPWDLRGFNLPLAHLYADSVSNGEIPLWDPYTYCGRPFQANIQTQVFYPPMALVAAAGAALGVGRLVILLELELIAHVLAAGVFAYWLGLGLKLSRPAALFLATVYMLGGFFAPHAEHLTASCTAAWLPLLLYCLVQCDTAPWRYGLLLAAALAASILAGYTPMTAVVWGMSILFAALRIAFGESSWRAAGILGLAMAGSVVLTLVELAPTVAMTPASIGQYRTDWLGSGGGVPLEALVSRVLPNHYGLFDLATYHQPFELTYMYLYCGVPVLIFAIAALMRPSSRGVWIFALLVGVCALAMLGEGTAAGRAAWWVIPQKLRVSLHPEYATPGFVLSLAALGAMGMERWLRRPLLRWIAVAVCAADLILVSSGRPMNATPLDSEPGITREAFEGRAEPVRTLGALTRRDSPPARIDTIHNSMAWAMAAPTLEIPCANGNDPLAPARVILARLTFSKGERWGSYYEVEDLRSPILGMLNVRYLVSRERLSPDQLAGTPFRLAAEVPGFLVYENSAVLPRFWLVGRIRGVATAEEAATGLRSPAFHPAEEALVEHAPAFESQAGPASGAVKVVRYGLKEVLLEVEAARPSYLATSETHYPGWRAWIDGVEQRLYYTNVAFRGLPVPAGRHTLRLAFAPPLLGWCGLVSLAGWLAWGALWWRKSVRGR